MQVRILPVSTDVKQMVKLGVLYTLDIWVRVPSVLTKECNSAWLEFRSDTSAVSGSNPLIPIEVPERRDARI